MATKLLSLPDTTVGKKAIMALSGAILLGFTIGHLAGNLQAYAGAAAFNEYAAFLHSKPALIWGTRMALLFAIGAHVVSAFALWSRNKNARPVAYKMKKDLAADYASKTMYFSGPILLFYIVFHLLHLTLGGQLFADSNLFGIEGYTWDEASPYNNMVGGFQHLVIVVPYVLGVLALGTHLFHGIYSAFQSLGVNHARYNTLRRDVAFGLAMLITLGNLSFPILTQLGRLQPEPAVDAALNY